MLAVGCVLLGAAAGWLVPLPAYRLAVPWGRAARTGCAACGAALPAGPRGWLAGRSVCRSCRIRLGPAPPATAAVGGVASGLLGARIGADPVLGAHLAASVGGLLLAVVDLRCLRLPDPLLAATAVPAGAGLVLAAFVGGEAPRLAGAALGGVVAATGHLVIATMPGARLGAGDIKLAALLGTLLGWWGWAAVALGATLPFLVAGPFAVATLRSVRGSGGALSRPARGSGAGMRGAGGAAPEAGGGTAMALGPALLIGAWLAVLVCAG